MFLSGHLLALWLQRQQNEVRLVPHEWCRRAARPIRGQIIAAKWIYWSTTASEEPLVCPAHRQNFFPETVVGASRQLCECSDWLLLSSLLLSVSLVSSSPFVMLSVVKPLHGGSCPTRTRCRWSFKPRPGNPPPCSKVRAEGRLRPSGEVGRGGGEGTAHVRCWGAYSLTPGAFWELLGAENIHVYYMYVIHFILLMEKKLVSEEAQKSAHSSQSDAWLAANWMFHNPKFQTRK